MKITGGTFAGDGDVLSANMAGTSITASYNSATETLTLSGSDTLAHYQQVLDSVTFASRATTRTNYGSNTTRTVTWTVDDGSGSFNLSAAQTDHDRRHRRQRCADADRPGGPRGATR